jgi:Tfp pilus assembly protein PilF
MRLITILLLTASVLHISCSGSEDSPAPSSQSLRDAAVADAVKDFDNGKFESALEKVDAVLAEHPEDPGAMRVKSMILESLGRSEEAVKLLEKLSASEPEDLDIQHFLGTMYFKRESWEKAVKHLEKSVSSPERSKQARELLIVCCEKLGQLDRAISLLEEMLKEDPEDAVLLTHMGNLKASTGKYREAIDNFAGALDRNKEIPSAYHGLAVSQAAIEEYNEVVKTLSAAISVFPNEPRFRITLAETHLQLRQPLEAIAVIDKLEAKAGKSKETEMLRNTADMMLRAEGKPPLPK